MVAKIKHITQTIRNTFSIILIISCILLIIYLLFISIQVLLLDTISNTNLTIQQTLQQPIPNLNNIVPPLVNNFVTPLNIPNINIQQLIPIQTQPFINDTYKQVGLLTNNNNNNEILPLMGQQLNRNNWRYFTMNGGGGNGNLPVKLPIKNNNRSCTGEYGCDELYDKDTINIATNNAPYNVTLYENDTYFYRG